MKNPDHGVAGLLPSGGGGERRVWAVLSEIDHRPEAGRVAGAEIGRY